MTHGDNSRKSTQPVERIFFFFALGENSPSSGPETASLALCLFITAKFQGRRVGGQQAGWTRLPPLDNALPYQGRLPSGFLSRALALLLQMTN